MNYDIVSYALIGGIFTAVMIPLIALLHSSIKEKRALGEVKRPKKYETPQQKKKFAYVGE